ncbi:hypothetical protein CDAR_117571 [Caerostris darwini]|uniref:Uncharacterized protein n=1 Tax=Caerostris darwini TaxID=1538125 RepID=A0AAV4WKA5_9ARAC|nr:hypothetical protein CDAR_117571 [Caerostris darwini]
MEGRAHKSGAPPPRRLRDTNVQGLLDLGSYRGVSFGPHFDGLLLSWNVPEVNIERKRLELFEEANGKGTDLWATKTVAMDGELDIDESFLLVCLCPPLWSTQFLEVVNNESKDFYKFVLVE